MSDIKDRFELLIFETAEEYLERKRLEKIQTDKKIEEYKREVEKKGECEGCGTKEYLRWVHNRELYLCQDCFMHDLQCQASVMVPTYRVDDMDGYDEYLNWDNLWEEENNIERK